MPYLGIFELRFEKLLSCLRSTRLNWSNCKISQKEKTKQKWLNLEPKMPYLAIFGLEFEKAIVIFEISTLEFV